MLLKESLIKIACLAHIFGLTSYVIAWMGSLKVETIFRLEYEGALLQPTVTFFLIFEFGV